MAKPPTKKPPTKKPRKKRLGKAGSHLGHAGKVVPITEDSDVDSKAIEASNKAVGTDVEVLEPVAKFPTFVDMKAKVHEGLIASNYIVYEWAQNQLPRMEKLRESMKVIEDISFSKVELLKLTAMQRIKLWKTFEQAEITRIELLQAINNKAQDISLTERFIEGYEREKLSVEGIPTELPYSPEFRAKVRAEYLNRVLGITQEPEHPDI